MPLASVHDLHVFSAMCCSDPLAQEGCRETGRGWEEGDQHSFCVKSG